MTLFIGQIFPSARGIEKVARKLSTAPLMSSVMYCEKIFWVSTAALLWCWCLVWGSSWTCSVTYVNLCLRKSSWDSRKRHPVHIPVTFHSSFSRSHSSTKAAAEPQFSRKNVYIFMPL